MSDNDDDLKLSPADVEKIKQAQALCAQASGILNDLPEDIREEHGNLEDAISKLEDVDELLADCLPDNGEGDPPV